MPRVVSANKNPSADIFVSRGEFLVNYQLLIVNCAYSSPIRIFIISTAE